MDATGGEVMGEPVATVGVGGTEGDALTGADVVVVAPVEHGACICAFVTVTVRFGVTVGEPPIVSGVGVGGGNASEAPEVTGTQVRCEPHAEQKRWWSSCAHESHFHTNGCGGNGFDVDIGAEPFVSDNPSVLG